MPKSRIIYELRIQCDKHDPKLDKAIYFYRVPNGVISQMYKGHEDAVNLSWPEKFNCDHEKEFTRTVITDYRWDIKENKPVKVEV